MRRCAPKVKRRHAIGVGRYRPSSGVTRPARSGGQFRQISVFGRALPSHSSVGRSAVFEKTLRADDGSGPSHGDGLSRPYEYQGASHSGGSRQKGGLRDSRDNHQAPGRSCGGFGSKVCVERLTGVEKPCRSHWYPVRHMNCLWSRSFSRHCRAHHIMSSVIGAMPQTAFVKNSETKAHGRASRQNATNRQSPALNGRIATAISSRISGHVSRSDELSQPDTRKP